MEDPRKLGPKVPGRAARLPRHQKAPFTQGRKIPVTTENRHCLVLRRHAPRNKPQELFLTGNTKAWIHMGMHNSKRAALSTQQKKMHASTCEYRMRHTIKLAPKMSRE
eukprot:6583585-Pyramimonas_sp.AAC.1